MAKPYFHRWRRYASVASQSIAFSVNTSTSRRGSATTCAAAYATRVRNGPVGCGQERGALSVNGASEPSRQGRVSVRVMPRSRRLERADARQGGNVEPTLLGPRLQPELRELDSLRTFIEVVDVRRADRHVTEEHLPLVLERVVELPVVGHVLPVGEEVERVLDVGIPRRSRRVHAVLRLAAAESRHCAPLGAVDLDRQQLVAIHPHRPRRVELRDDVALRPRELEGAVRRVVRRRRVATTLLVDTLGNVRRSDALDRRHLAEGVIEHVAPVAEHVGDDPAAILGAIIPRRTPRTLRIRPKNPESTSRLSFRIPGRNSLSCTTPCFTPAWSASRARSSASSVRTDSGFSQ